MTNRFQQAGFTLVEIIFALAMLSGLTVMSLRIFTFLEKQSNLIEFHAKKEQLRRVIIGQILTDENNCGCMFQNSAPFDSAAGTPRLMMIPGKEPKVIGRMDFPNPIPNPLTCDHPIPIPLVKVDQVIDKLKLVSASISNIKEVGGEYVGNLEVLVNFDKEVFGPNVKGIRIPVGIKTSPDGGGKRSIIGCSMKTSAFNSNNLTYYSVLVPRNQNNQKSTSPNRHNFCVLAKVESGGNNGGNVDRCEVKDQGMGIWEISGGRGDDPDIECGMYCI